ncbi:MAG: EF-hand domain-containing protein [Ekhidna sp.]|nr:EF-hand domain-containing protein [Ekhidna sp.]MBC6409246.1 EF-hand domain-containing protein [Ekhidna sp.]MBC6425014.1 EF-hand domain-containing protein [Ekhidna sp.]
MLTNFQKEKISHYFRVVLDQDRNGVLEEEDFKEIGESLCTMWGYKPGTPNYDRIIDNSLTSWKTFKSYFEGMDAVANEEQFIRFYEKILAPGGEKLYKKFVLRMVRSLFDAFDLNKDSVISVDEYSDMFMCYHIPIKYSAKAFVKLDRDGDNYITKKELLHAINEFFKSKDECSPGNWLFGFWGDKN